MLFRVSKNFLVFVDKVSVRLEISDSSEKTLYYVIIALPSE